MNDLPITAFDIVVAVMALMGLLRGRKRGMSGELIDLLMWVGIAGASPYAAREGGPYLANLAKLSLLWGNVLAYLAAALVIFCVFSVVKNIFRERMGGSDFFRGLEYPLGMLSGLIRFMCMLLVVVALVNARLYTEQEKAANAKEQKENFGNISLPGLAEVQSGIFQESFAGQFIGQNLQILLVPRTGTGATTPPPRENLKQQREAEMNKVIPK